MPLQKITFQPGANRENTRYTNEGRWWDMDHVRFRSGTPEKIGGWVSLGANTFQGVARFLHNWITLGSENLLAVGTNLKLYVERGQQYFDITPVRYTLNPATNNPFLTGAAGSSVVTATCASHGAILGDFVTFSGAVGFDGILTATLNAEFQITSVPTSNTFTFVATPCTAGATSGGGAAVVMAFQVTTGPELSVYGVGFGVGAWGSGGWGLAASGTGVVTSGMRQWVGGNWGQDLVFAVRDSGVYYWATTGSISTALATRAVALSTLSGASNPPIVADNLLVTDDEYVLAIGTNPLGSSTEDPLLVRWCDQGNVANWTPAVTNTAGGQRITAGSYTFAAKRLRQENLIWTDTALISVQSVGPPIVFSFVTLAENISIASVNAVGIANNVAYWMGKDKFYVYSGQVQTLPCDVRKYVFSNINTGQLGQVAAGTNAAFNEVTWFYCSLAATSPDRYVTYNYLENLWTFGSMARTAWLDSPLRPAPMAASADKKMYYHETGFDDGSTGGALTSFLESADFDIGDGQSFSFVDRIIPDVDFDGSTAVTPSVVLTLKARDTPGGNFGQTRTSTVSQTAVIPFGQFTENCWTRIRGRQLSFRLDSTGVGVTWQLGTPRLSIREDGQR